MKKQAFSKIENRMVAERRMIYEMIEASMALAKKKGTHPITAGCSCIACANRRKALIYGSPAEWKHRL
ncbi:MAG: hypothetical protein JEZ11_18460 [Desulfobacterales bacterium]|nr:hypothetical protein [Desulfobacterales bacterium]